ncbi:hypothetical protein CDAR_170971 [Caerostris darwini]|uniref:Uncharacterized protein n=1 Tax=Caerostris darwini TaxID=1538125 RepID=A0AAV4P8X1_9ARAC|nr:hypothetical protein CDAR_170971 [Caerostris darwini]
MCRRLFSDNRHSVFKALREATDYIFVGASGKNTLYLVTVPSGERSCSLLASRATQGIPNCHRRACVEVGPVPARENGHAFQNAQKHGDFLCVQIPISLCVLDAVHDIVKYFREKSKQFRQYPLHTYWFCGLQVELLKEKRIIEKSDFYDFFKPYVGTDILTCDSSQWKERRKLLVSRAACSKDVFNEHAQKLVDFLHEETGTCVESPISL